MKPFFCYYGGKWRTGLRYPEPKYGVIVEPFAGGAGYSLRYADRKVILVERDPLLVSLWKYLIRVSSDEIRSIPLDVPEEGVDQLLVAEEAKWLVGFWCNKGTSSPRQRPSKWMREGSRPNSFWGVSVRERIASQVDRIRHWQVQEGSYESAPRVEATWFVDPPYSGAGGDHYKYRKLDYKSLGSWCQGLPGQVIVCENEGADWLPFHNFGVVRSTKGYSREVVWTR